MVTSFDRPVLDLRDIVKIYDNERLVLDRLNLSVEKSEVLAIIGPSGCGKSTLLRCINGLEDIQGGEILLDGEAITDGSSSWSQVRQRVGMVFQSYDLFPHLSVMDNLVLAPVRVRKQRKEDVEKKALGLLERVGLADRADAYPHQLSGGQKQRVAIVRALIMEPDVLLLDEITASLDPEMVREVLDVVADLAEAGMTMLIVTHEMRFAREVGDKLVFMHQGKVHETGDPKVLFANPRTPELANFIGSVEPPA